MYLDILHVFYTYPKRVQDTFYDTYKIHQDTCILGASLVSHWIHIRIHQDTCILDSSSRYIRIHRDTKSRYMYMCVLDGIHAGYNMKCIPRMYPERYVSEMQDTYKIYLGYMYLQRGDQDTYKDTYRIHLRYNHGIHVSQMHPERDLSDTKETCGIHAGYMRHSCILRGNQDTCWIHAGYTCGIHSKYVSLGLKGMN
jgi:hypothetical protein